MEDIKVLIVDDSALMRSLIGKIIDGTPGLAVSDKAMNGRFALQKLERVQPDIIVLDLEMPEMNGMNVRMNGKKRPRNTASGPHLSIMASVLAMRSGVMALTLPDSMMRRPKKWPIQ